MSEAEVVSELGLRTEITWNLMQWWISVSFAAMIAAYLGAQKLTKSIVALIIGMYILTTFRVFGAVTVHTAYVQDLYVALQSLAESEQLSAVGAGALERNAQRIFLPIFNQVWVLLSFLFTIGFIVYCYKHVRKPE